MTNIYCCACVAAEAGDDSAISILERGEHRMPFEFRLPDQCIPCSFESRIGTIRYYLRVIIDIPYASQPQGLKYFTVIGQLIDCLSDKYTVG
jgi:Arrestin (or S-antigen), N-terminal domain